MTPRNTLAATSITRPSAIMADPAELFDGRDHDPGDCVAALGKALAHVIAARPSWHDAAACRRSDIDFTKRGDSRPALELCGRCEVMAECRQWAAEIGDTSAELG